MSVIEILPFISTVIMLIFTVDVFKRYLVRRAPHFLFWGIGLAMFGLGSFAEAYLALSWSRAVLVIWFLFGAILNPAWIGMGTLYLLVRKRWVHVVSGILILASLVSTVLMLSASINDNGFHLGTPISQQYQAIISTASLNLLLIPTILFGTTGLILLVGGALYSAFLFWRKRVLPNRVIGNVLIAAGALSVGSASELTHLGYGQLLYVGELVAAVLMYIGFRFAAQPQPDEAPQAVVAAAAD
ncbi:MAG TPA: hypothetical protein VLZ89_01105 [Anaerolineales bacterium]|nr:hypothetical protein [Anaerolineales bacterium]